MIQKRAFSNEVEVHNCGRFVSSAEFVADSEGRVDLWKDAPLDDSSYEGVMPMGLFESLKPAPELRKGGDRVKD